MPDSGELRSAQESQELCSLGEWVDHCWISRFRFAVAIFFGPILSSIRSLLRATLEVEVAETGWVYDRNSIASM